MKKMNFEQMEVINGGQTITTDANLPIKAEDEMNKVSCALSMAAVVIGIVGFVGTGGVGAMAWVAIAGLTGSSISFVRDCKK